MKTLVLLLTLPALITPSDPIISSTTEVTTTPKPSTLKPCVCHVSAHLKTAEQELRDEIKITQTRLIDPVRTAMGFAMSEKQSLLDFGKFLTFRDVTKNHPTLMENTEFVGDFEEFYKTVGKFLLSEKPYSSAGIKHEISMAMSYFMKKTLAQSFLCLAVGKCRTVPLDFMMCMDTITNWELYFGDSSRKAANHLAESIYRYRKMESIIEELHTQLMNSTKMPLSQNCLSKYIEMTMCNCTEVCGSTCVDRMEMCFSDFMSDWSAKLLVLKSMTSGPGILTSFMRLRRSILDSIQLLVERKSPLYAEHMTAQCGAIGDIFIHPKKQHFVLPKKPAKYNSQAERAAKELQLSVKTWEKMSRQICNSSSVFGTIKGNFEKNCTIGTHSPVMVGKSSIEEGLPPITKDVRPRPMIEAMEKERLKKLEAMKNPPEYSGNGPNWDDEGDDDEFESSASGAPPQIIDNSHSPKAIIEEEVAREEITEISSSRCHTVVSLLISTVLLYLLST